MTGETREVQSRNHYHADEELELGDMDIYDEWEATRREKEVTKAREGAATGSDEHADAEVGQSQLQSGNVKVLGETVRPPTSVTRAQRDREQTGQIATLIRPSDVYAKAVCEDIEVVKDLDFAALAGIAIPLAHSLGIPLRLACMANIATSVNVPNYNENYVTSLLGVVVDPEDARFGEYVPERFVKTREGSVMLFRSDGKDFGQEQAEALLAYCGAELEMVYDVIPKMRAAGIDAKAVAKGVAAKALTPAAYTKFWEAYRGEKLKADMDWEGLECPAVVQGGQAEQGGGSEDVCGACTAEEGKGGSPLLQCGRCKTQRYCSKECQRKDWRAHKVGCAAT
ncbi:hypothetical protein LTR36_007186 [Oleoguttula mirabilis]|uniref:MYND-type domain-containing protein n=1 Tax=Oleoguttula mirabilis TaxID=1507867 RepID=A0AAV9JAN9_9PEZI|nr:hypothetical protein LTR36_007186 [Oleoguttula mirabilis]